MCNLEKKELPSSSGDSAYFKGNGFIVFSPFAGVLPDRSVHERKFLYIHISEMGIVGCFAFVTEEWQIYVLVISDEMYSMRLFSPILNRSYNTALLRNHCIGKPIGYLLQLINYWGVLGPGLGKVYWAIWLGGQGKLFFVDALPPFVIAGILLLSLPKSCVGCNAKGKMTDAGCTLPLGRMFLKGHTLVIFQRSICPLCIGLWELGICGWQVQDEFLVRYHCFGKRRSSTYR